MRGDRERRKHARLPMRNGARVRVRPAGSNGIGRLACVHDACPIGVRLAVDGFADESWDVVEILTASGRRPARELLARVIWMDRHDDGRHYFGCCFEI